MGKEAAKTKEDMQAIQRKNEISRIRKVGDISLFSLFSGCLWCSRAETSSWAFAEQDEKYVITRETQHTACLYRR